MCLACWQDTISSNLLSWHDPCDACLYGPPPWCNLYRHTIRSSNCWAEMCWCEIVIWANYYWKGSQEDINQLKSGNNGRWKVERFTKFASLVIFTILLTLYSQISEQITFYVLRSLSMATLSFLFTTKMITNANFIRCQKRDIFLPLLTKNTVKTSFGSIGADFDQSLALWIPQPPSPPPQITVRTKFPTQD